MIGSYDKVKEAVMIEPHDADGREADQKSRENCPLTTHRLKDPTMIYRDPMIERRLEVQHQQRYSDGKNAIAESFNTRRFLFFIHELYPLSIEVGSCSKNSFGLAEEHRL